MADNLTEFPIVTKKISELASGSALGKAASFTCHDLVNLVTTDYLEVFITNITDTTAITVEDLNVIIERIG